MILAFTPYPEPSSAAEMGILTGQLLCLFTAGGAVGLIPLVAALCRGDRRFAWRIWLLCALSFVLVGYVVNVQVAAVLSLPAVLILLVVALCRPRPEDLPKGDDGQQESEYLQKERKAQFTVPVMLAVMFGIPIAFCVFSIVGGESGRGTLLQQALAASNRTAATVGGRTLSTPSGRLIGHWMEARGSHAYYGPLNDVGVGEFIAGGLSGQYKVVSDERRGTSLVLTEFVNVDGHLHAPTADIEISMDGSSMSKEWTYDGLRYLFMYQYADARTQP